MTEDCPGTPGRPGSPARQGLLLLISGLGVGGAERLVLQLARGLSNRGWHIVVVGLESDAELLDFVDVSGLDIRVMGLNRSPLSMVRTAITLRRLVREEKINLIHAHLFHSLIFGLFLRITRPALRLVFTSHNYSGFSRFRETLVRFTRRFRHGDVLFGEDQHPHLNSARSVVIPNGVEVAEEMPVRRHVSETDTRHLLYLGRLTPEKNVDHIIAAVHALSRTSVIDEPRSATGALPLELSIAGDGPELDKLKSQCRELAVEHLVHFLGMRSDVHALLGQCHLLVMASSWEGLPMVVLEAGSVATPVLATPVGRLPILLGESCGFLAPVEELIPALREALSAPQRCESYGRNLYERVMKEYSMRACVDRHQALYLSVLQ